MPELKVNLKLLVPCLPGFKLGKRILKDLWRWKPDISAPSISPECCRA